MKVKREGSMIKINNDLYLLVINYGKINHIDSFRNSRIGIQEKTITMSSSFYYSIYEIYAKCDKINKRDIDDVIQYMNNNYECCI